jgi:hypothetical protein
LTTRDNDRVEPTEGDDQEEEFNDPYFTEAERDRLKRWRVICSQRPALTREQIETVGALLRAMGQRRASKLKK